MHSAKQAKVRSKSWISSNGWSTACFGDYVREATKTQITDRAKTGGIGFLGCGYLTWIGTLPMVNSYRAARASAFCATRLIHQ